MSENQNADLGTAENNTTVQSTAPKSGLNEDTLANILRNTLFEDDNEQTVNPNAENAGEDQTEVNEEVTDTEESAATETEESDQIAQAEDGDDSNVHSQSAEENMGDSNLSKGVQKRIDKITAKRKQAEEEAQSLRTEVESLKKQIENSQNSGNENKTSVTDADNPFSSLKSKSEVEKEVEQARWLKYKCMENPEGFSMGETEYTHSDVQRMLVNATKAIELHLPKQLARLDAEERIKPIAEATYPWWKNAQTKEYQLAQQVLRTYPDFKRFPDYQLFVGDYIRGFLAREAAIASKDKSNTKAPIQSIRPTAVPAKPNAKEAGSRNAEARFAKSTNAEDLAKVLLSKGYI